jgi:hypothetical protein
MARQIKLLDLETEPLLVPLVGNISKAPVKFFKATSILRGNPGLAAVAFVEALDLRVGRGLIAAPGVSDGTKVGNWGRAHE